MTRVSQLLDAGDHKGLEALLKETKRTINHTRDRAGDRGSAIHKAAQSWATEHVVPNPALFPEEHRGYVRAFAHWVTDYRPEFLASEVIVASTSWGYAGTYDARVRIKDRIGIVDFKTSKALYPENHVQLAAYELAAIECGADPTDFQALVRLGQDGDYEHEECVANPADFLTALEWFKTLERIAADRKRKRS